MAKQQHFIVNQSARMVSKLNKYCKRNFGMSFAAKMEARILQVRKEFTKNILEHITKAEKIYGKEYLKIKE